MEHLSVKINCTQYLHVNHRTEELWIDEIHLSRSRSNFNSISLKQKLLEFYGYVIYILVPQLLIRSSPSLVFHGSHLLLQALQCWQQETRLKTSQFVEQLEQLFALECHFASVDFAHFGVENFPKSEQ